FGKHGLHPNGPLLRLLLATEQKDLAGELPAALRSLADLAEKFPQLVGLADVKRREFCECGNDGQDIIEVVSNRAGKHAERLQPLRLFLRFTYLPGLATLARPMLPAVRRFGKGIHELRG